MIVVAHVLVALVIASGLWAAYQVGYERGYGQGYNGSPLLTHYFYTRGVSAPGLDDDQIDEYARGWLRARGRL